MTASLNYNPQGYALYNWHVELSSKCPLRCPRCQRTEEPDSFTAKEIDPGLIKKLFNPELMSQIKRITFSGNYGDPIYHSQFIEIVEYLKNLNPLCQLVIVTNGSHKKNDWWESLAEKLTPIDEIIFSIDGWNHQSNSFYRKGSDWNGIMSALEIMTKSEAYVRWSTIVFKNNMNEIENIKTLAQSKNVDHFHLVLSDRFGTYNETYLNDEGVDPLEPEPQFISQLRRTYRLKYKFKTAKWAKVSEYFKNFDETYNKKLKPAEMKFKDKDVLPSCLYGYRGMYVDVNGIFTPCSWINHPYLEKSSPLYPGKIHFFDEVIKPHFDELNLNKHSLEEVLNSKLWAKLSKQWEQKGEAYVVCERKCLNPNTHIVSTSGDKEIALL